jgi:two-component system NarL family sensor kinase
VAADALQLERAIDNLLLNALNHAPRDSQILVQLRSLGSCHRLEVSDSGPGIPLAALPKLFDRFYQAGSDRQLTGSGLGLYLSRQIIEAHGGRIWAENRSPQGATFLVELAACPPPIAPQAHANSVD